MILLSDETEVLKQGYFNPCLAKPVEDMSHIALAHMSVEEAATQLLAKHSVSREEFRIFYELIKDVESKALKDIERADAAEDAAVIALKDSEDKLRVAMKRIEKLTGDLPQAELR